MYFKIGLILTIFCAAPLLYGQENTKNEKAHQASYESRIDLTNGTQDWAKKIASIVYDETIPESEKTFEFNISKQESDLLVNAEVPLKSDNTNKEEAFKSCKTLTKTCRSEKCVANTLIEILGKGDRDVVIKYERKLISVRINYTYQDCK